MKLVRLTRQFDEPLLALAAIIALIYFSYYCCFFLVKATFIVDQTKLKRLRCDPVLTTVTLTPGFVCWRPFPPSWHQTIHGICDRWNSSNADTSLEQESPCQRSTSSALSYNSTYSIQQFFLAVCGILKFNVGFKISHRFSWYENIVPKNHSHHHSDELHRATWLWPVSVDPEELCYSRKLFWSLHERWCEHCSEHLV
jgi:hypothetical protein